MKLKFRSLFSSTNEDDHIVSSIKYVENLFEQEDILFRCKQLTDSTLLGFLSKNTTIIALLEYVTQMVNGAITISILPQPVLEDLRLKSQEKSPNQDKSQEEEKFKAFLNDRVQNKYTYMATEIMCSIVGKYYILPKIVDDEALLSKFFSVLNLPKDALVRFATKQYVRILTIILNNTDLHNNVFSYFYRNDGIPILNLLKFSDFASDKVSEIIKLALSFTPPTSKKNNTLKLTNANVSEIKSGIVQQLVRTMNSDDNLEVVKTTILELLALKRPSGLVDCIIKTDSVQVVLSMLFQDLNDPYVCDASLDIIQQILFVTKYGDDCIETLQNLIEKFVKMLENPSYTIAPLHLTTGELAVPFGLFRLRLVEFFRFLFDNLNHIYENYTPTGQEVGIDQNKQKYNGESLLTLLKSSNVLPILMKLFYDYPYNNLLHNQVTLLMLRILSTKGDSVLTQFVPTIISGEHDIIPKLMSHVMDIKQLDPKKAQCAYIGHLIQIGYALSDLEFDEEEMEEKYEGWSDFIQYLKDKHFVETVYRHGGDIPLPRHMIDWDEDSDDEFGLQDTNESAEHSDEFATEDIDVQISNLNINDRPGTPAVWNSDASHDDEFESDATESPTSTTNGQPRIGEEFESENETDEDINSSGGNDSDSRNSMISVQETESESNSLQSDELQIEPKETQNDASNEQAPNSNPNDEEFDWFLAEK